MFVEDYADRQVVGALAKRFVDERRIAPDQFDAAGGRGAVARVVEHRTGSIFATGASYSGSNPFALAAQILAARRSPKTSWTKRIRLGRRGQTVRPAASSKSFAES